jgi:deazaflavin-dependent oxidoreductase (nitroreductase family)
LTGEVQRLRRVVPPAKRGRIFTLYTRIFGTTRPAMWFSKHVLWKVDPVMLRLTRGRFGLAPGLPTAILDTVGARTGEQRRHTVIYFHDGERVTIVASKLGLPEHPAWFHNLLANPDVTFGGIPMRATVVADEAERQRLWTLADQVFGPYAAYRREAAQANRTIPIVQLTPMA